MADASLSSAEAIMADAKAMFPETSVSDALIGYEAAKPQMVSFQQQQLYKSKASEALSLAKEALVSFRRAGESKKKVSALKLVVDANMAMERNFDAMMAASDELAMIKRTGDKQVILGDIRVLFVAFPKLFCWPPKAEHQKYFGYAWLAVIKLISKLIVGLLIILRLYRPMVVKYSESMADRGLVRCIVYVSLFNTALRSMYCLLTPGHMSSNLAEASALSACEGAEALKLARSPEGHAMAWQELLAVLPELSQVSPKADFEALCKISAEQLLPRSRADPVRRLGQALVQIAMPSRDPPQEPPSPKSEDMSVKNDSIPLGNRDDAGKLRRWSEKSSGAYQVRPKVSMARSKEQIDLSKMIRKDPAWKVAQKTEEDASESEIADVEDL